MEDEKENKVSTPEEFEDEMSYENFVKKLVKGAKDEKTKKWIDYAFGGDSGDIKIKVQQSGYVPVSKLVPTQNFIGLENSIGFTVNNPDKAQKGLTEMLTKDSPNIEAGSPIWIFEGKYIIDGHHRWSQVYAFNPNAKIAAINFSSTEDIEPKQALAAVQGVIASTLGKVPIATSKVDGKDTRACNVLTEDESTMLNAAEKCLNSSSMKEEFSDLCENILSKDPERKISGVKSGFKNDDGAGAKVLTYAVRNCLKLKQSNNSINDAPDREYMPQTGTNPKEITDTLTKGVDDVVTKVESRCRHGRMIIESADAVYEDIVSTVLEDILNDKLGTDWTIRGIRSWLEEWGDKMMRFVSNKGISDKDELADSSIALRAHRELERMIDDEEETDW